MNQIKGDFIILLSCAALLAILFQDIVCILFKRLLYPNLAKAVTSLRIPVNIKTHGGKWEKGFYRDENDSRLKSARLKYVFEGILFRDIFTHQRMVFSSRIDTILVPWCYLIDLDQRNASVGWYNEFFMGKGWLEVNVDSFDFSIIFREKDLASSLRNLGINHKS